MDYSWRIRSSRYGDMVVLNEYNGTWSVAAGREGKDGKTYMDWAFPQDKDRQAKKTAIPVKANLGELEGAIEIAEGIVDALKAQRKNDPVSEEPEPEIDQGPPQGLPVVDDGTIPF